MLDTTSPTPLATNGLPLFQRATAGHAIRSRGAGKLKVTARRLPDGGTFTVTGTAAATLLALVERGPRGVTPLDHPGGPAFRLAAVVHKLRTQQLIGIVTERETHDGGEHARYRLVTPVEVLHVDPASKLTGAR